MDLYAENILDHYRDPRNKGSNGSISFAADNPACGDELTVYLTIEGDVLQKIEWEGTGCAISQAGMSMLSEQLEGMQISDVESMGKADIYEMLGVPVGPRRFKCALICLHAVKNAVRAHAKKDPESWLATVELSE